VRLCLHACCRLVELCAPAGASLYHEYCVRARRSYVDVLEDFASVDMPLAVLVESLPPLRPRAFSVASAYKRAGRDALPPPSAGSAAGGGGATSIGAEGTGWFVAHGRRAVAVTLLLQSTRLSSAWQSCATSLASGVRKWCALDRPPPMHRSYRPDARVPRRVSARLGSLRKSRGRSYQCGACVRAVGARRDQSRARMRWCVYVCVCT
jgi:hypothetical protein